MRRPSGKPLGKVYRRTGRDGQPTQWWWLRYKFPGEPWVREPTSPRTADEVEAERQLNARLAERGHQRQQRLQVENLVVDDLLDLYVLDCADQDQPIQVGRVEVWRHALGHRLALEVTRVDLDDLCRRWKRRGPTWKAGTRIIDGVEFTWKARDPDRVRPLSGRAAIASSRCCGARTPSVGKSSSS